MTVYHDYKGKRYYLGCNRSPPHADARRLLSVEETAALPATYTLKDGTPIEDQGQEGACSAFALNGAQMVRDYIVSGQFTVGSKQQFYRCETAHDGDPGQDNGSTITTSAWVYKNVGIAPESMYPYSEPLSQAVPENVIQAAAKDESLVDTQLDAADENTTIANMKAALASNYPVRLGFTVYESFMDTGSGGNMPAPSGAVAGGHAVCSVGYDDTHTGNYDGSTGAFLFRNSWGTSWGNNGHFWMPYSYFLNTNDGVGDVWALISENDFPNPSPPPNLTPPVAPANFTWGINQLVGTQLTLVGSTYDAKGDVLPNAQINIDRSSARGTTQNWTRMGSPVSNAGGAWRLTMPVASGPNFFWLVTADGKRGYWSTDEIYLYE